MKGPTLRTVQAEWQEIASELHPDLSPEDLAPFEDTFYEGFMSALTLASQIHNADLSKRRKANMISDLFNQLQARNDQS